MNGGTVEKPVFGIIAEFPSAAALYEAADGYPYFVQAYGKVTWDVAASSPIGAADVAGAIDEIAHATARLGPTRGPRC